MFGIAVSPVGQVCWETALTQPAPDTHSYSTPLVSDGSAIFDSDGDVFAVNLSDGRVKWEWKSGSPITDGGDLGGNQIIAVADGVVVTTKIVQDRRFVVGLDDRTGTVRWERQEPTQIGEGPYDSGNGSIIFTSYQGTVVEVIDDSSGSVLWSGSEPSPPSGPLVSMSPLNPLSLPGVLVVASPSGGVDAVDAMTGKVEWHYGGSFHGMTTAGGVLLLSELHLGAGPITQSTVAVDPKDGRTLWSSPPSRGGPIFYTSAGDALIEQDESPATLSRIEPATGSVIWGSPGQSWAEAASGDVVADVETNGSPDGTGYIVGHNVATGVSLWKTPVGDSNPVDAQLFSLTSPTGAVFVVETGTRHQLIGYDARTGAQKWDVELPSDATTDGTTVASDGLVVQLSGTQYAIQGH